MRKNNIYESIMSGLEEALDDSRSSGSKLKRHTITVEPVKHYDADEIKIIRHSTGMSQKIFASYMGVSEKTIEAWEAGRNHPSGTASRLLRMMEMDRELINRFPFVKRQL